MYHSEGFIFSETYNKLENLVLLFGWQQRTTELLQNKSRKPQLEEIELLLSEYNQISFSYFSHEKDIEENSDAMEEEKTENEMILESTIEELPEKQQLENLLNSCKEWLEKYNDILKKSVENLQTFNLSLERPDDDSMIIEEINNDEECKHNSLYELSF